MARDKLLICSGKVETRGEVEKISVHYAYMLDPVDSIATIVGSQAGVVPDHDAGGRETSVRHVNLMHAPH